MTSPAARSLFCALALLLISPFVHADEEEAATRYFHTGVTLYREGNYTGALAAFDEAKRVRKTASVLQNIALCQRALFEYTEAIATLEELDREFGNALPANERKSIGEAIHAMRSLVVRVVLAVTPHDARVVVDGKTVPGGAERTIDLAIGQRKIEALAPGFRPFSNAITVSPSERRIELVLTPDVGTLTVASADKNAVISVDGAAQGGGAWSGSVRAGVAHAVVVAHGHLVSKPFEVMVASGERRDVVEAPGGERIDVAPAPYLTASNDALGGHRGPYAAVGLTSYFISTQPDGYHVATTRKPSLDGAYFNARIGYRAVERLGIEGFVESGEQTIERGCYAPSTGADDCGSSYTLVATRVGIGGRYFSPGESFRFLGGVGLGGAYHGINIYPGEGNTDPKVVARGANSVIHSSGWNGFVLLEVGVEAELRGWVIDGIFSLAGDGVNKLRDDAPPHGLLYTDASNIWMAGVGVRVGYTLW